MVVQLEAPELGQGLLEGGRLVDEGRVGVGVAGDEEGEVQRRKELGASEEEQFPPALLQQGQLQSATDATRNQTSTHYQYLTDSVDRKMSRSLLEKKYVN